jgi:hypothetical protein
MTVCGHFMQHRWVYIYRTRHKAWLSSQCPDDSASDSAIYPPLIPLQIVFVVSEPLLRSHRVRRIRSAQVTFGLQLGRYHPFPAGPPTRRAGEREGKAYRPVSIISVVYGRRRRDSALHSGPCRQS